MSRGTIMVKYRLSVILLCLLVSSCIVVEINEAESDESEIYFVTRVVDGDTVLLDSGEKVRFLAINTPEKWEYYYVEATQALRDLIENKTVVLVRDVSDKDKYGRILRYVYLEDDTFVNAVMVDGGYAKAYHYPPDTLHYDQMLNLETQAKAEGIGIWNVTASSGSDAGKYPEDCKYVSSKSGAVYYSVECKYANRILVKNRVCFENSEQAVEAGYRLTAKC